MDGNIKDETVVLSEHIRDELRKLEARQEIEHAQQRAEIGEMQKYFVGYQYEFIVEGVTKRGYGFTFSSKEDDAKFRADMKVIDGGKDRPLKVVSAVWVCEIADFVADPKLVFGTNQSGVATASIGVMLKKARTIYKVESIQSKDSKKKAKNKPHIKIKNLPALVATTPAVASKEWNPFTAIPAKKRN